MIKVFLEELISNVRLKGVIRKIISKYLNTFSRAIEVLVFNEHFKSNYLHH